MAKRIVTINWKNIQFEICLPKSKVWPFALEFGKRFPVGFGKRFPVGTRKGDGLFPGGIDGYYVRNDGYHVRVSVRVRLEQEFYEFLRSFCEVYGLPVKEKDLEPFVHE